MSGQFSVNPADLRALASKTVQEANATQAPTITAIRELKDTFGSDMRTKAQTLASSFESVRSAAQSLVGQGWTGSSANQYMAKINQWDSSADQLLNELNEHITKVQQLVDAFTSQLTNVKAEAEFMAQHANRSAENYERANAAAGSI